MQRGGNKISGLPPLQGGIKATQRAIEEINSLVYSGQVNLKILNLPDGKDADEFLKSRADGVNSYRELIEKSPFWIDWQISQMLVNKDLKQGLHFQQVANTKGLLSSYTVILSLFQGAT